MMPGPATGRALRTVLRIVLRNSPRRTLHPRSALPLRMTLGTCSAIVAAAMLSGCGDRTASSASGDSLETGGGIGAPTLPVSRAARLAAVPSLSRAAGGEDGTTYRATSVTGGVVSGTVTSETPLGADTTIEPSHDQRACRRFTERPLSGRSGTAGDAVVWLHGVATGPENRLPKRVALTLEDCRLSPRVVLVAAGGTVLVGSRDPIMARLRFTDAGTPATVRSTVAFNDAGQVMPDTRAAREPGLVAVRDDMHPWVRGYVAVAPHPFVAVTGADGAFRFEGVPAGTYQLVVWHERRGTRAEPVVVEEGREEKQVVVLK